MRKPGARRKDPTGPRYLTTVAAIEITAAATGFAAARYLPYPLAVITIVGTLVAAATAPFITPLPPEDTRP